MTSKGVHKCSLCPVRVEELITGWGDQLPFELHGRWLRDDPGGPHWGYAVRSDLKVRGELVPLDRPWLADRWRREGKRLVWVRVCHLDHCRGRVAQTTAG